MVAKKQTRIFQMWKNARPSCWCYCSSEDRNMYHTKSLVSCLETRVSSWGVILWNCCQAEKTSNPLSGNVQTSVLLYWWQNVQEWNQYKDRTKSAFTTVRNLFCSHYQDIFVVGEVVLFSEVFFFVKIMFHKTTHSRTVLNMLFPAYQKTEITDMQRQPLVFSCKQSFSWMMSLFQIASDRFFCDCLFHLCLTFTIKREKHSDLYWWRAKQESHFWQSKMTNLNA